MRFAGGSSVRQFLREGSALGTDLKEVFTKAVQYDSAEGGIAVRKEHGGYNPTPLDYSTMRSNTLDAIRKLLPHAAGGYSQKHIDNLNLAAQSETYVKERSYMPGQTPAPSDGRYVPQWQKPLRAGAELAGVSASDMSKSGLQSLWWLLNAPQALAMVGSQVGLHNVGRKDLQTAIPQAYQGSAIRNPGGRMQATLPATIGAGVAIGGLTRLPGYQALYPDDEDKTKTTDPVGAAVTRFFRSPRGRLLKFKEFKEERPDVSYEEYADYWKYLRKRQLVKGTMDGIHGPEVSFLGASIPLLTGIVPVAGAIAGTRMAAARKMNQLASQHREPVVGKHLGSLNKGTPMNPLETVNYLRQKKNAAAAMLAGEVNFINERNRRTGRPDVKDVSEIRNTTRTIDHREVKLQAYADAVGKELLEMERTVDVPLLRQAMIGGFAGLTASAAAGHGLELARRELVRKKPEE